MAKKRYLKAKARKHKTLKAAKKASTPKNKKADKTDNATVQGNAEAGPSSPAPFTAVDTPDADVESKAVKKEKKSKKDKGKAKEENVDDDAIVPGGANDEEAARLLRKQEKRAKREARRLNKEAKKDESGDEEEEEEEVVPGGANDEEATRLLRKQEKRAKRESRKSKREAEEKAAEDRVVPQLLSTQPGNISDSGEDDEPDLNDTDLDSIGDGDETASDDSLRSLSGSPPPLEAFPLPTSAPAPDPSLLSRQGLPTGLNDATFIPQDLRLSVDSLEVTKAGRTIPALSDRMKARLSELGISEFFAVQAYMLPRLLALRLIPWPNDPRNDFLISAPTGSGKTLAYCVPIIEVLSQRVVTRLRALIVLPTRDLVVQVRETLEMLSKGTSLKVSTPSSYVR